MAKGEPLAVSQFTVEIDGITAGGFSQVVLPEFAAVPGDVVPVLVLRRAATGSLELYRWWDEARHDPRGAPRSVAVLAGADGDAALRWRFKAARPLSIGWLPLDAMHAGVLVETLTLAFERMEME